MSSVLDGLKKYISSRLEEFNGIDITIDKPYLLGKKEAYLEVQKIFLDAAKSSSIKEPIEL